MGSGPSSTAGLTIASYEYRHVEDGGTQPVTWTPVANVLTVDVTNLTNGTEYDFEVRAVSTTGAKGNAASRSATPATVPGAPSLTATDAYKSINLEWTAPSDNGGAAITGYRIERQQDDGSWRSSTTRSGSSTSWTAVGLADSTSYTYRIFAINVAGDSDWTSATATTLAHAAQIPGAPTNLVATAGSGKVSLTWDPPAFDGGSTITSYEYRYKDANDESASYPNSWTSAGNVTEFDVPDLDPGTTYDFELRARNAVGPGTDTIEAEASGPVTATAPTAAPVISISRLADTTTDGNDQFRIQWDALGADVDGTGVEDSNAISDYRVEWYSDPGYVNADLDTSDWPDEDTPAATQILPEGSASSPGLEYTVVHNTVEATVQNFLTPGATYYYRVRAVAGVLAGKWSNVVVSMRAAFNAPVPPTVVTTEPAGTTSIKVSWTAPASNGGTPITSYDVQVRTATTDSSPPTIEAFDGSGTSLIENLPANNTSYIHRGVRRGAALFYYYRVRANNAATHDKGKGAWSDITTTGMRPSAASVGTPGVPDTPNATNAAGTVTFGWLVPASAGDSPITGYEIQYQRDDDNSDEDWSDALEKILDSPLVTQFIHEDVAGGTGIVWEYRVRAVNSIGAGEYTDPDSALDDATVGRVAILPRPPSAPALTATAVNSTQIRLEWTEPQDNGTDIDGYAIERVGPNAADNVTTFSTLASVSATARLYVDGTAVENDMVVPLIPGAKYEYRIQATTDGTNGTWSATTRADAASATTPATVPGRPTLAATTATVDDPDPGSVSLVLTTPASDGGADISRYELQIWYDGRWNEAADLEANDQLEQAQTAEVIDGLTAGQLYYFATRARNSAGAGQWSELTSASSASASTGQPDTPVLSAAPVDSESIKLTWTIPEDNGTTITGYQLQVWDNAGSDNWTANSNLLGDVVPPQSKFTTEYTHEGLSGGTEYSFRIRALTTPNTGSAWSTTTDDSNKDAISAKTHGDAPIMIAAAPTVTALIGGDDDGGEITVTWDAPMETGGSAITGYDIQIWDAASSQWVDEASLGDVLTYSDTGLDTGTYYYRVRARSSEGAGPWSVAGSNTDSVKALTPDAPVLTLVILDTSSIRITWTEPDSHGGVVEGYTLQKWDNETSSWPDPTIDLRGVSMSLARLYEDEVLAAGTTYYYRVKTVSGEANVVDSDWSQWQQATTIADGPDAPTLTSPVPASDITDTTVTLNWDKPGFNGGSAIIRYELWTWNRVSKKWEAVNDAIADTSTSITVSNLTPEATYAYRLRAVNRAPTNGGLGDWSTMVFVTTEAAPE